MPKKSNNRHARQEEDDSPKHRLAADTAPRKRYWMVVGSLKCSDVLQKFHALSGVAMTNSAEDLGAAAQRS